MKSKTTKITLIIEKTSQNYSAYIAECPGCIATGKTEAEVEKNLIEAFKFHLEGLELEGETYKPQVKVHRTCLAV
jgi:predicted RNase H-like HicB family nuclease